MSVQYSPYLIPLFTATAVSVALAAYAWRHRASPAAIPFALLMLFVTQWSMCYAFELFSVALQTKLFWAKLKYLGVTMVPMTWLVLAHRYTRQDRGPVRRTLAILAIEPVLTLLLVWTNDVHGLIWSGMSLKAVGTFSVLAVTHGTWFWVHALYSYILLFLGIVLMIRKFIYSPHLFRRQNVGLLIGVFTPWIGNASYLLGFNPFPYLDLTPFAFTVTGLALAWSVFGLRLLKIVPVARDAVIESMNDMVIVLDAENLVIDLNPAAGRILGSEKSRAVGQPAAKVLSPWPDLLERCYDITDTRAEITIEESGAPRHFDLTLSPLFDKRNQYTGKLIFLRNITERKMAEEVLRKAHDELEKRVREQTAELTKANEQLKCEIEDRKRAEEALKDSLTLIGRAKREWESTADSLPHMICLLDSRGLVLRTNRTIEQWQLNRVTQVKGKRLHDLIHPGCDGSNCYLEDFWTRASGKLAAGEIVESEVEDPVLKRSLRIQVRPISASLHCHEEETANYSVMVLEDICDRKRAEKEMAALQEQFRQSQKMEAIGRLAGGIAHDFNNMLTPIVGYSQLAMKTLAPQDPLREDIAEIQKGAIRAADLIRKILTFSSQKSLNPRVINLNTVLIDIDKMLRRLIGEHIEMVTLPDPGLGSAKIDPSQLEQVLVNLVVNARDAMPRGGKLVLKTADLSLPQPSGQSPSTLPAGRYVMVSVSDTGCGMSPEVKERLFEPFFTTKGIGGGTGLGLSTVYGIVSESRGSIFVDSEPGQGTTFKIYFPHAGETAADPPVQHDVIPSSRGNETILLVEDDPAVREFAARALSERGYQIVEAAHGLDALRVIRENAGRTFHLLLTDVVMPQMGGKELAERLTTRWDHLKVLFFSGYTDHTLPQGVFAPEAPLLEKPFSASVLAAKVREVLDHR